MSDGLTRTVADGFELLKREGVKQSAVAAALGVSEATVSRWANAKSAPSVDQIAELARRWPASFDNDRLSELFAIATFGAGAAEDLLTSGVKMFTSATALYEAVTASMLAAPDRPGDRVIRQMALHMDRRHGVAPNEAEDHLDQGLEEVWKTFADAVRLRAGEGWRVVQIFAAATEPRVDELQARISRLEGEDIRTGAYGVSVPRIPNFFVVGGRDVFLAVDDPRWELPASGLLIRNAAVARWANEYIDELYWSAPYKLREPHRLNVDAFDQMRKDIRNAI